MNALTKSYERKKYKNIKKYMNTGDLLLFCSHSISTTQLIKLCTKSCWTHIGIIYRCNNKLFICEFTLDFHKSGFNIESLDNKIKKYNGKILYKSLNKNIDNKIFISAVNKYKNKKFTPDTTMFMSFAKRSLGIYDNANDNANDNLSHCSEFVYNVLKDLNIISSKINGRLIYPCDFCKNKKILKLLNGYEFKNSYILSPIIK